MPQVLVTPACKIHIHNSIARTIKYQKLKRKITSQYIWFSVTGHPSKSQRIDAANNTCCNTHFENHDQVSQYQPSESLTESICFQVSYKMSLRQC